jgi:hypothetical protein
MTTSKTTAQQLAEIVRRYVPEDKIPAMLDDLAQVPGNKSFREVVQMLEQIVAVMRIACVWRGEHWRRVRSSEMWKLPMTGEPFNQSRLIGELINIGTRNLCRSHSSSFVEQRLHLRYHFTRLARGDDEPRIFVQSGPVGEITQATLKLLPWTWTGIVPIDAYAKDMKVHGGPPLVAISLCPAAPSSLGARDVSAGLGFCLEVAADDGLLSKLGSLQGGGAVRLA